MSCWAVDKLAICNKKMREVELRYLLKYCMPCTDYVIRILLSFIYIFFWIDKESNETHILYYNRVIKKSAAKKVQVM